MNFTSFGTHKFQISVDGDAIGDLPVSIMQMQAQAERRRTN